MPTTREPLYSGPSMVPPMVNHVHLHVSIDDWTILSDLPSYPQSKLQDFPPFTLITLGQQLPNSTIHISRHVTHCQRANKYIWGC